MFLKRARPFVYKDDAIPPTTEMWSELADSYPAQDPGATQPISYGFVSVVGDDRTAISQLVDGKAVVFLRLRVSERKVPPAVLRDELEKRLKTIEQETGRNLDRKGRFELKDSIHTELLAQAFVTHRECVVAIFQDMIIIDGTGQQAELFLTLARKHFGTMPVIQMVGRINDNLSRVLFQWTQCPPERFSLCDDIVLVGEEKKAARFSNGLPYDISVAADQIGANTVKKARLVDHIRETAFTVDNDLILSRINMPAAETEGDDPFSDAIAELVISASTVRDILLNLVKAANGGGDE